MFDRFTDRARKILGLAVQAATRFQHDHIGPEHILIGLSEEGSGVAASGLRNLDVDLERLREEVEGRMERGEVSGDGGSLPFTQEAKRVLEKCMDEAGRLGHSYVGSEHLLLALLAAGEGIPARVLPDAGVTLESARREVRAILGSQPPGG